MAIDRAASRGADDKFYKLPREVVNSHAWRALSTTARALWLDMRVQIGTAGTSNGKAGTHLRDTPGQEDGLARRGWTSSTTVFDAAFELEVLGFIRCEVQGGIAAGGKTPKLWSLTHLDVFEMRHKGINAHAATHDYRRFQSVEHARETLAKARQELVEQRAVKWAAKLQAKQQKPHRKDAGTASESPKQDAETAHGEGHKMQKLHRSGKPKIGPKASVYAALGATAPMGSSCTPSYAETAHPLRSARGTGQSMPAFITGKPQAARLAPLNWRLH